MKQDSIPVGCVPPTCQPYGWGGGGVRGQTDTCENITFPQLRWRVVTIFLDLPAAATLDSTIFMGLPRKRCRSNTYEISSGPMSECAVPVRPALATRPKI